MSSERQLGSPGRGGACCGLRRLLATVCRGRLVRAEFNPPDCSQERRSFCGYVFLCTELMQQIVPYFIVDSPAGFERILVDLINRSQQRATITRFPVQ